MDLKIIKFGGSVITDRNSKELFNSQAVLHLGSELPDNGRNCILIHGTGQVGKPPASKYGYLETGHLPSEKNHIALKIKTQLRRLNQLFVDTMMASSILAYPLDTASFFNDRMGAVKSPQNLTWLKQLLNEGLTPVFYGDLVPFSGGGFKVFSSDVIALILCRALQPDRMLFLSNVPGVYRSGDCDQNDCYKELSEKHLSRFEVMDSDKKDVSGGMSRKVECAIEIARYCGSCFIGSGIVPSTAMGFLEGKQVPGTLIKP